jgi:hypothetical protein
MSAVGPLAPKLLAPPLCPASTPLGRAQSLVVLVGSEDPRSVYRLEGGLAMVHLSGVYTIQGTVGSFHLASLSATLQSLIGTVGYNQSSTDRCSSSAPLEFATL